jgi:hypothetical protein
LLDRILPPTYGNLAIGLLALGLAYGFSRWLFAVVERQQARAVVRERGRAALGAAVGERQRPSRQRLVPRSREGSGALP